MNKTEEIKFKEDSNQILPVKISICYMYIENSNILDARRTNPNITVPNVYYLIVLLIVSKYYKHY